MTPTKAVQAEEVDPGSVQAEEVDPVMQALKGRVMTTLAELETYTDAAESSKVARDQLAEIVRPIDAASRIDAEKYAEGETRNHVLAIVAAARAALETLGANPITLTEGNALATRVRAQVLQSGFDFIDAQITEHAEALLARWDACQPKATRVSGNGGTRAARGQGSGKPVEVICSCGTHKHDSTDANSCRYTVLNHLVSKAHASAFPAKPGKGDGAWQVITDALGKIYAGENEVKVAVADGIDLRFVVETH